MNRYDELGSPLVFIYAELETELIKNIAKYINELDYERTGFAFKQLKKLGLLNKENAKLIAKAAKKSLPEIKRIINDAGIGSVQETNRLYKEAMETGQLSLEPVPLDLSPELRSTLDRSLANAKSMFNLTNTQAVTFCQRAFLDASNKAYLEVANGLKTRDEAVKDAVLELAKNGIRVGNYVRTNPETGEEETYYRNRMDTIVRRNIQTTIAQTEAASVIAKCKEFGVNTVAVSGHFGARVSDTDPIANHYGWQLKVYSIEGETDEFPNLEKCTGYPSNPLGLCGYNCRHRIYIFIPGVSKLPMENYNEEENRKYYEATQKQRAIERDIRTLKRQIAAGNVVGADTTALTAKLGEKQAKMRQFVKENGLIRNSAREQENTGINNRSISAKATWAHRKETTLYRKKTGAHRKTSESGREIIDKATYNKLTRKFISNGGIIIRGKEAEEHLGEKNLASYLPSLNTAFIRDDATVSEVIEEMYHAEQDRTNMFGEVLSAEVRVRREIDAQKLLLSLTEKYKIPLEEVEETKRSLAYYEQQLELLERGEV